MRTITRWLQLKICFRLIFISVLFGSRAFSQDFESVDPDFHPLIDHLAPEIKGTTLNDGLFDLSSVRGKIVLVNFWSFTCAVCYKEILELNLIAERYRNRNVIVISLMPDDRSTALTKVAKFESFYRLKKAVFGNANINYEIIPDATRIISKFQTKDIFGVPMSFVIDKAGKVRAFSYGYRASYSNGSPGESENFKVMAKKIDDVLSHD